MAVREERGTGRLSVSLKLILGWGEHSIALTLSALSLLYVWYLTRVVGMEPALAAAIPMLGRTVDALTDPLMGRLSDLTRLRAGRRRPYFLIGALPFGLSFGLLWFDPGLESGAGQFAFCAGAYVFYALASTVVSVPYVAILPEIVPDFDERTSVNAYRSALNMAGTLAAAGGMRPLAGALGQGAPDFFLAGCALGAWIALPWLVMFASLRERPELHAPAVAGLGESLRALWRHPTYRQLTGMYVCGRIAIDLVAALLVFYFDDWLRRPQDFETAMALFLVVAAAALPLWVRLAERTDKHRAFAFGCAWWGASMLILLLLRPDFPTPGATFALVALAAVGYGAVDMLPWSMLADVVDEDELRSGERREGLYGGAFTFLRKLGGAGGVLLAGLLLQSTGYVEGSAQQTEAARQAVRWTAALGPALFLGLGFAFTRSYALTRERHRSIVAELEVRRARRPGGVRPSA
jgi:sugar (glycoside-pentoside-hexuronide) transporter